MRFTAIHVTSILLILGFCEAVATDKKLAESADRKSTVKHESKVEAEVVEEDESSEEEILPEEDLPILPPIILLDFDNGTTSGDGDEKSKRTVNGNLGYGFDRNNLGSGKYNYYFPAGKSGTTVSIEESVTPFLPKTIIERVPSSTQRPQYTVSGNNGQQSSFVDVNRYRYQYFQAPQNYQPVYGERTKLQKVSNTGFAAHQTFSTTTKSPIDYSTIANDFRNSGFVASTTPTPQVYNPADGNFFTPRPVPYYQANLSPQQYSRPGQRIVGTSSLNPLMSYLRNHEMQPSQVDNSAYTRNSPLITSVPAETLYSANTQTDPNAFQGSPYVRSQQPNFSNLPKYTVENGIRYENKIYWKYPDGRVTDQAPPTYIETYGDYSSSQAAASATSQQQTTARPTVSNPGDYQSNPVDSNVYSQAPVQFPIVPESGEQQSNPFISSESLASNPVHQQVYRLGYQSLIGQKSTSVLAQQAKKTSQGSATPARYTSAIINNSKKQKANSPANVTQRPHSRYMVNSPNPEYTDGFTTESPRTMSQSSRYSTPSPLRPTGNPNNLDSYSNLEYSDLLKYNPSISQYVRDPSSILNVRPTFVQAGNSLIPVIILRVDGAPPIEPKITPNINLKALLQQYLLQYANNVQELARPSLYDLGTDDYQKPGRNDQSGNTLQDLARLSPTGVQSSYETSGFGGDISYDASRRSAVEKSGSTAKFGDRTTKRQKVKSVQIVEDPRYPPYKENN